MDSGQRLVARARRLDEILRDVERHVAAGRQRLARQTQIVALEAIEGPDDSLALQLLDAMRQTQESLEGAARQFKVLSAGLVVDEALISQSEIAVFESFHALGVFSPVAPRRLEET